MKPVCNISAFINLIKLIILSFIDISSEEILGTGNYIILKPEWLSRHLESLIKNL